MLIPGSLDIRLLYSLPPGFLPICLCFPIPETRSLSLVLERRVALVAILGTLVSGFLAIVTVERKRDSLVLWRGRGEYDRFAQALSSTLPRITDLLVESSAVLTSEGDTEYEEIIETGEEKTLIEKSIPKVVRKAKIETAGLINMRSFEGRADGMENPSDYNADIEMAAMVWDATVAQNTDNWKITIFRQNLNKNGNACHWWTNILKPESKQSFPIIKVAFF